MNQNESMMMMMQWLKRWTLYLSLSIYLSLISRHQLINEINDDEDVRPLSEHKIDFQSLELSLSLSSLSRKPPITPHAHRHKSRNPRWRTLGSKYELESSFSVKHKKSFKNSLEESSSLSQYYSRSPNLQSLKISLRLECGQESKMENFRFKISNWSQVSLTNKKILKKNLSRNRLRSIVTNEIERKSLLSLSILLTSPSLQFLNIRYSIKSIFECDWESKMENFTFKNWIGVEFLSQSTQSWKNRNGCRLYSFMKRFSSLRERDFNRQQWKEIP